MAMRDVAVAQREAEDDAGLLYSLHRAECYWRSILESEKSLIELRARAAADKHFDGLADPQPIKKDAANG
jgi:hypothetical protein